MPEQLNPSLIQLRDRVKSLGTEITELVQDKNINGRETTTRIVKASKEAGVFFMTQPKEFGGSQASLLELTIVRDTLGSMNLAHIHGIFGPGPGVLAGVDEPLKSTYLEPQMSGDKRGAFGFTEPDNVERHTWGRIEHNKLIVNGQKSYVTGGADADFINTLVEIEDQGKSMVVIDRNEKGVSINRTFDSLDGTSHAYLEFKDVTLSINNIIGKPGEGIPRALGQIGNTRLAFAAESVGLARWVIDFVTEHLKAPHRSGIPLGEREGVRMRYSDMRIQAFAARSMVYRTARIADSGENVINEVIACKVFATEMIAGVVDTAIQLVGGVALRTGHPLEELYRRIRTLRLAEGASDILRISLAKGQLELAKGRI